jgi:hypothetical protein
MYEPASMYVNYHFQPERKQIKAKRNYETCNTQTNIY